MKKLFTIMLAMLLAVSVTGTMVAQDTGGSKAPHKSTQKGHKGGKKGKKSSGGSTTPPPK